MTNPILTSESKVDYDAVPGGAASDSELPVIRSHNVQGDSLAGFKKPYQVFIFLRILDPGQCRKSLSQIIGDVSTLSQVWLFNYAYHEAKRTTGSLPPALKALWVNIAFSWKGLLRLWPRAPGQVDVALEQGMRARASLLGDVQDLAEVEWKFGANDATEPDAILLLAADDLNALRERQKHYRELLKGFSIIWEELGERSGSRDTFGFRDGVSQPRVKAKLDLAGNPQLDIHHTFAEDDPMTASVSEFLIGYDSAISSGQTTLPVYQDCSLVVFRRYLIREDEFKSSIAKLTKQLRKDYDAAPIFDESYLASRLIGRWPNGAFVDDAFEYRYLKDADASEFEVNRFRNLAGISCPNFAHILKTNPRNILHPNQRRHIMRRGIGFKTDEVSAKGVGLMFVCYQASIERQFEHILRHWMNNPNFPLPSTGHDAIAGNNSIGLSRIKCININVPLKTGGFAEALVELPQCFVSLSGGCYALVPSIELLRLICS